MFQIERVKSSCSFLLFPRQLGVGEYNSLKLVLGIKDDMSFSSHAREEEVIDCQAYGSARRKTSSNLENDYCRPSECSQIATAKRSKSGSVRDAILKPTWQRTGWPANSRMWPRCTTGFGMALEESGIVESDLMAQ